MTFDEIIHSLSAEDQKVIGEMMALFERISHETKQFSQQTGLTCKSGCGACCSTPDIETTVAEVVPLAVHLWAEGSVDGALETIRSRAFQGTCVLYQPDPVIEGQGRCSGYAFRPGLCRLFGYSARHDKYGRPTLMTCKVIKDSQPDACQSAQEKLQTGLAVPLLAAHSFAVANIDPAYGQNLLPINQAISLALEKVGYKILKQ